MAHSRSYSFTIYGKKRRVMLRCFRCGGTTGVLTYGKMDWCKACAEFTKAQGGHK